MHSQWRLNPMLYSLRAFASIPELPRHRNQMAKTMDSKTMILALAVLASSLLDAAAQSPFLFYPVAYTNIFVPTNSIGSPDPPVHFRTVQSSAIDSLVGPNSIGTSLIAFDGIDENDVEGLFLWTGGSGGTLRPVITASDVLPGFNENYGGGGAGSLRVSGNTVYFLATTGNPQSNQTGLPEEGLYSSLNGTITKVVDTTDRIPGGSGTFIQFGEIEPETPGSHYFIGRGTNNEGVYVERSGALSVLVDRHTLLPYSGTNLSSVYSLSVNRGQVAFAANPSPPFDSVDGVYAVVTGAVQRVASIATNVGPYNPNVFANFGNVLVRSNLVLFKAGGNLGLGPEAIFQTSLNGAQIQELVGTHTLVPGTTNTFPPGFIAFDYENGVLVFQSSCYCQSNSPTDGVYMQAAEMITRVLGTGDLLGGKVVTSADITKSAISDGFVALHVTFADNSQAIYTTGLSSGSAAVYLVPISVKAGCVFALLGQAGRSYRIQATTDLYLPGWTDLANVSKYVAPLCFTDSAATASLHRFYRVVSP
jgi:hypothetical protein